MKKILFIDKEQFGTLTDTLKYCQHLNLNYQIKYICFDKKYPHIEIPYVNVKYIPFTSYKIFRGLRLITEAIMACAFFNGFIYIVYFPGCALIKKILFWKKMHIDVRTLSVVEDKKIRIRENKKINSTINLFNSASFISEGIKNQIIIKRKLHSFILPLGSDIISNKNKKFEELRVLYIGTLNNRNIIQTVIAIDLFIKNYPNIPITYDIIGDGEEFQEINDYIIKHQLEKTITLHGRIPHSKLTSYLDQCNVGISYIPIVDYYEFQPPTKTYEYILSGLYCIATATIANKEIINDKNGILIRDNPSDVVIALYKIYLKAKELDSNIIRNTLDNFQWKNIINKYFLPIINQYDKHA